MLNTALTFYRTVSSEILSTYRIQATCHPLGTMEVLLSQVNDFVSTVDEAGRGKLLDALRDLQYSLESPEDTMQRLRFVVRIPFFYYVCARRMAVCDEVGLIERFDYV